MNITDNIQSDAVFSDWRTKGQNEDPLSLKKAIKAYRDEHLTGLTDDELAEIQQKIQEYLKENPIKTASDRAALDAFIKSLLKQYGYKGDVDEYASSFGFFTEEADKERDTGPTMKTEAMKHFEFQGLGTSAAKTKLL